jgi:hypothetical protein
MEFYEIIMTRGGKKIIEWKMDRKVSTLGWLILRYAARRVKSKSERKGNYFEFVILLYVKLYKDKCMQLIKRTETLETRIASNNNMARNKVFF